MSMGRSRLFCRSSVPVVQHEVTQVAVRNHLETVAPPLHEGEDLTVHEHPERVMETMHQLYKASRAHDKSVTAVFKACCVL